MLTRTRAGRTDVHQNTGSGASTTILVNPALYRAHGGNTVLNAAPGPDSPHVPAACAQVIPRSRQARTRARSSALAAVLAALAQPWHILAWLVMGAPHGHSRCGAGSRRGGSRPSGAGGGSGAAGPVRVGPGSGRAAGRSGGAGVSERAGLRKSRQYRHIGGSAGFRPATATRRPQPPPHNHLMSVHGELAAV